MLRQGATYLKMYSISEKYEPLMMYSTYKMWGMSHIPEGVLTEYGGWEPLT